MFDLYSNLFTEEETNYFASDGNKHASPPPSYHSKYITTILPGGITPDVVVFGGTSEIVMRRGSLLRRVKRRSPHVRKK